jgi:hypothetical protein
LNRDSITGFFSSYENVIRSKRITPENTWNVDEMGIRVGVGRGKWVVIPASADTSSPFLNTIASLGETEHVTMVEAISGSGEVLNPMAILKGVVIQRRWFDDLTDGILVGVSDTGYSNDQLSFQWIQHFNRFAKPKRSNDWRLLILDGYDSHFTYEFVRYCELNRIQLLQLPPHSTHILQPCDVGIFQNWKHFHSEEVDELVRRGIGQFDRQAFLSCIESIRNATFKRNSIRSVFRKTGLIPL